MRLLSQTSATSPHYSGSSRHISTLPHLSARSATSPLSHTSPHFPPHLHSPTPLRTFRHISTLPHLSALSATSPLSHTSPHFPPHLHSPTPPSALSATRTLRLIIQGACPPRLRRPDVRRGLGPAVSRLKKLGLCPRLASGGEDRFQFVGWDDFKLREGAVFRFFVGAPAAELGRVAKALALHVIVRNLDHQLRS